MKTLDKIIVGTALALGLGCSSGRRIESIALPEGCAEVISMERSGLTVSGRYTYYVGCKEKDGKYVFHVCNYDNSRKEYSCRSDMIFKHTEKNKP